VPGGARKRGRDMGGIRGAVTWRIPGSAGQHLTRLPTGARDGILGSWRGCGAILKKAKSVDYPTRRTDSALPAATGGGQDRS
jgi:hypothetical protein